MIRWLTPLLGYTIMVYITVVKQFFAAETSPIVLKQFSVWQELYTNNTQDVGFDEAAQFQLDHQDWPGQKELNKSVETRLKQTSKPLTSKTQKLIINYFSVFAPISYDCLELFLKLLQKKDQKNYKANLHKLWGTFNFSSNQQMQDFYIKFKRDLNQNDIIARVNTQFYMKNSQAAFNAMDLLPKNEQDLIKEALHIQEHKKYSHSETLTILHKLNKYPGLVYLVVNSFIQSDNYKGADAILLSSKYQKYEIESPSLWWPLRNIAARTAIRHKDYQKAYKLVSMHQLDQQENKVMYVTAEWLRGWIGFTLIGKAEEAAKIFTHLYDIVSFPVSLTRMACWAAFAYKEIPGRQKDMNSYLQKAAQYPETYYGQIAIATLGENSASSVVTFNPLQKLTKTQKKNFDDYIFIQVIQYLYKQNQPNIGFINMFFEAAIKSFTDPIIRAEILNLASKYKNKHMHVHLSKLISNSNIISKGAYPTFPITDSLKKIVDNNDFLIAMAHAIARQESSFNPKAVSGASAMGLMQLLMPVAKKESSYIKSHYNLDVPPNVFNEADNVMMGTSHMKRLFSAYGGRIIKCLCAYNAGEKPLHDWVQTFGDPDNMSFDELVQWIELIPYGETRDYVMRVTSNFIVYLYRLRLVTGWFDFSNILTKSIFKLNQ